MRFRAKVIVAALVMIPAVLTQTPASASWCAQYSGGMGGESCGFSTFEQCLSTVSVSGANFCRPSQYKNPSYASAGRKKRRYWFVSERPIQCPRRRRADFSLSVFDDFSVRLITLRTFECAPVVIWFVRFDATEPHRYPALRALRQVESQSRCIKNSGCGHGHLHAEFQKF